jgi:hypothetical protein
MVGGCLPGKALSLPVARRCGCVQVTTFTPKAANPPEPPTTILLPDGSPLFVLVALQVCGDAPPNDYQGGRLKDSPPL